MKQADVINDTIKKRLLCSPTSQTTGTSIMTDSLNAFACLQAVPPPLATVGILLVLGSQPHLAQQATVH